MPKAGDNHHHHIAQHALLLRLVHLTTWFIQASAQGTTKKGKRTSFGALLIIISPLVCCERVRLPHTTRRAKANHHHSLLNALCPTHPLMPWHVPQHPACPLGLLVGVHLLRDPLVGLGLLPQQAVERGH
jgi:hypothetical protein